MFDVLVARNVDVGRHIGDMLCRRRVWIGGLGSVGEAEWKVGRCTWLPRWSRLYW